MIGTSEAAALMAVDIIIQRDDARPPLACTIATLAYGAVR